MCGIAGVMARSEDAVRRALPPMLAAQAHRGPDDEGAEYLRLGDWHLGLGHRRLSILDCSPLGHQPMFHPQRGDCIIFNGEIYNFQPLRIELESAGVRFKGHSDTEVLLHAMSEWGPSCIKRLQGMFAFAFFDAGRQRLILARDSIGIKPLYFAQTGESLVFASEVRAVLASGLVDRKLDPQGLAGLLAFGSVQHPTTLFKSVSSLSPGSWQVIESTPATRLAAQRFWSVPPADPSMTHDRSVEAVRSAVDASVRDHLVADVPVGMFLSSGLDSTVVAGVAARHCGRERLRSFTVGFADEPDMSELDLARETAGLFGLEHSDIQITGSEAAAAMADWLQSLDQPSMDGLNVYVISKAVRERGITVALCGQGGDEMFGGYSSFSYVPRIHRWLRLIRWMPLSMRSGLASLLATGRSTAVQHKAMEMATCDGSALSLYLQRRRAMSSAQLESLGIRARELGLTDDFLPPAAVGDAASPARDMTWNISRLETQFYLGNTLLRDNDTNGMAHSLEIRVPLLDQRILDLAMSVPGEVRLPPGAQSKALLRAAYPELLRPALQRQGKRGFSLPISRWMVGPLRELCADSLEAVKQLGLLRPNGVQAVWNSFEQQPDSQQWSRAFTLCVLGQYLRHVSAYA